MLADVAVRAILAVLPLLALACGATPHRPGDRPATRPTPWTLLYSDGAANDYIFTQPDAAAGVEFRYIPITPETSSTGQYSGGDPVDTSLPPDDPRIDELWRRVDALAADPALLTPDRAKGTGAFHMKTPSGDRQFIVEMGPALDDFKRFVARFRP